MAGKVEVYNKFSLGFQAYNGNNSNINGPFLNQRELSAGVMEEDEVRKFLSDNNLKKRAEVLEKLLLDIRRSNGKLHYNDCVTIFQGLSEALLDDNSDIRLKCVQFIIECINHLDDDLDPSMNKVLQNLIPNIGDSKITIRRSVVQALHLYMKFTGDFNNLLKSIFQFGLDHADARIRREMMITLPVLLTSEFSTENFFYIVQQLIKKLLDNKNEDNMRDGALITLQKIHKLVGDSTFKLYLQKLSSPLRRFYLSLTGNVDDTDVVTKQPNGSLVQEQLKPRVDSGDTVGKFEFGIIPHPIMKQIYDQDNFRTRAQAVEELKNILNDLYRLDLLLPHMVSFIGFINNLLDDSNFKITMVSLEILQILVEKLGDNIVTFMRPLSSTLMKRMGDNKIVVRQAVMKVSILMMHNYSPKTILGLFCENLEHKNSRVRQELINITIAALLKFPSYSFDLSTLCQTIGPLLLDSKRHVRQAALECFAVLAQAMGPGKLLPLVQAVDVVELKEDGEGVMAAVQARLTRRILPKLNHDDLIEYAIPLPTSGMLSNSGVQKGADIDWIMLASGSATGSARSQRSDYMEIESLSSRSSPVIPDVPSKRYNSAGKGRGKLPWDEEQSHKTHDTLPHTAPMPIFPSSSPNLKQRSNTVANGGDQITFSSNGMKSKTKFASENSFPKAKDLNDSAVSPTRSNKNKVPPITSSTIDRHHEIERDDSWADESQEMYNSLRQIRNSASKKKAARLFENLEKRHSITSRTPSPPYSIDSRGESGIFTASTIADSASDISALSAKPNTKKGSLPFESKPKLARNNSQRDKKSAEKQHKDEIKDNDSISHMDYNPTSGVTFRENRNSDVQIVGKGYNEESKPDCKPPISKPVKERRQRPAKAGW